MSGETTELSVRLVQLDSNGNYPQGDLQKDIETIKIVTNDAFQADTFFKKPEYYDRFTSENVHNLLKEKNSAFVLVCMGEEVRGSLYLHWEVKTMEGSADEVRIFIYNKFL